MVYLNLDYNSGFQWFNHEDIHIKGYAFANGSDFLSDETLISYFRNTDTFDEFNKKVADINGIFSVVCFNKKCNEVYIAVDRMRMFPLFYSFKNNELYISDNIHSISENTENCINTSAINDFMAIGYTTSTATLYNNIFQLVGGSAVALREQQYVNINFYHRYTTTHTTKDRSTVLQYGLMRVIERMFDRLIESLNGRTAIVPLSGGYDSRLIVAMLHKAAYKNVICYTYGRKGNAENKIAEQIAKKLGYQHLFIDYDKKLWQNYITDQTFNNYFDFTTNGVSMLFLQEYFATKYLCDNHLIPTDAIFIPGHLGDFIGGSQITKHNIIPKGTEKRILNKIFSAYFLYAPQAGLSRRRGRTLIAASCHKASDLLPTSVFEDWVLKERSKIITNSANVYNFFGYQHRLPFWDNEFIDFYKNVSYQQKKNKKLYVAVLEQHIFKPLDILFCNELQPTVYATKINHIKKEIKKRLPSFIKQKVLKESIYSSQLCMGDMVQEMIREMKDNNSSLIPYYYDYNFVVIQWCVFRYLRGKKGMKNKHSSDE